LLSLKRFLLNWWMRALHPALREWTRQNPYWLDIRKAPSRDPSLLDVDTGEGAAIALAELESEVLLLIDESAGRLEASRRGVANTGTLGVLRAAAMEQLIDLPAALDRLMATNFRVSKALIAGLVAEDSGWKHRAD
jgi:predicted nucleic acid-binding protein